jgi:tetratricopeptide (TPR) repeat protein
MCLALGFAVAQPLNPQPATNSVGTNVAPPVLVTAASDTNFSLPTKLEREDFILATARYHANLHEFTDAEKEYVKLLGADTPESTQKSALFEMGGVVRNEGDYTRAAAIYTQYVQRWPEDSRIPELYLQQGRVFRDMGVPNMALAKFYGVMTTALALKSNQLDYYKHIVLEAQVEIADTHYQIGKFQDAVDYYSRLLTQNDPSLDREQIQFRLIRCLEAINRHDDAVTQAHDFLEHYPTSAEEPEVRYHLAQAYKAQNRTTEALQEVKTFLKEEHDKTTNDPAVWAYWQQRVGNEIGNQLYQEGDYVKALQVYLALSQLDPSAAWQLPVRYQVGLTYEKLLQPKLAMAAYRDILTNTVSGQTASLSPDLKSVVDMAGWRLQFLQWSDRAAPYVPAMAANTSTNLNANQP